MVAEIERTANAIGRRIGVAVGSLRLATVLGPHVPSALGRVLRTPIVPFSALADPPFAVIHQHDAAEAFVAAARARIDEPLNIVAPGAITALQAARRGKRIPAPLLGPEWGIARGLSYLTGAPLPDHVLEMLHRGRLADNARAREVIGFAPTTTTGDVIDQLYGWPSVIHTRPVEAVA
jgi:UDP-glucose 4-epimerase